jgi:hypothetical protein
VIRRSSLLVVLSQAPEAGFQPQDPGWTVVIPGLVFIVLAAVVWWIWRRLADSD